MTYEKRGLYIEDERLEAFAENLARGIHPSGSASGKAPAAALRAALQALDGRHDALELQWAGVPSMPGAVRWLLDNRWLLRREGRAAAQALAAAKQLRFAENVCVLKTLCEALIRSGGNGAFSEERLLCFLRGFQKTLILEREELALLPAGLKWAIVSAMEKLYCGDPEFLASPEAEAEAGALFNALRELGVRNLSKRIEETDLVEQALRGDPSGIYPKMAARSRAAYRLTLSRLARRHGVPEHLAAKRVLELAQGAAGAQRHVGYWLYVLPLGAKHPGRSGGGYIAANVLLTLFLSLTAGFAVGNIAVFFLLALPVSELVKQGIDFLLLHLTKPVHLPRLALRDGVPPEGKTLCVISALLKDAGSAPPLAKALESAMLLNRDAGDNLSFALLADLPEGREPNCPGDEAALDAAAAAVEELNARHGGGFFLLTRQRRRNSDGRWVGWERKRGALLETMYLLRGRESGIQVRAGSAPALAGTRFLLVLDSDTRTSPGAAKELIGAMLHPLCTPQVDTNRGLVTAGHGILAPRMGVSLRAAGHSYFSRVFAGQGGGDPYRSSCSELCMDLFGRSNFAGKGLIHIDAYLACMEQRVPEEQMLSHDAVEGAFLRCGYCSDVECFDDFPSGVLPYYRRLERWVRGDWQNLIWLGRRGKALPQLEKYRLLDSLRRALTPVATLTAIAVGLLAPSGGLALAAGAAALASLSELLLTGAESLLQKEEARGQRYRSAVFVGVNGGLVRALLRLLLLPVEAVFCLAGTVRALWRMGVSRKKMLQWQTASDSEGRAGLIQCFRALWFSPALGLLLLLAAPGVAGKTVGLLWLLCPLCARLLSLPAEAPVRLSPGERAELLKYAKDTWRYFADYLTAEDNFLPPDNVQSQPPGGPAHRTSPTNIGLALLSVLAAMDLGFLEEKEGLARIRGCLATVERLEKWRGHLYNWYDTQTLSPLNPPYVSTVDSGNFCACLIALRHGLLEHGAEALARRAEALANAMSFAPLYDRERKLFYIGLDPSDPKPPEAWYDLLASEARLTAYLTVARGDVPPSHWERLSRALLQYGRYRGMASWTGTMFEYLMPELLLPAAKNSLLWESARFCLFVQRRRVRGTALPWGCSESAYWALDPGMNYRYKAHGCGHLALKRGMDEELVISPYSSFLALCVQPHAALANLRKLAAMDMRCPWGFWEALDCTRTRLQGGKPRVVRCVMAHHAGMSLVAAANLLQDNVMQRRFCAEPAMEAYRGLLQERVPVGGSVLRFPGADRSRPPAAETPGWIREGSGTDFLHPACCLLASETYTLLVSETGAVRPRWGAAAPYLSPRSPLEREKGLELLLEYEGKSIPLLPEAYGEAKAAYDWQFTTDSATIRAVWGQLECQSTLSLAEGDAGERRELLLRNSGEAPVQAELVLRLRPLLAREADFTSHPAFWGLGMSAKLVNGCLLLRRLPRNGSRELWMCLALSRPCSFDLAPGAASGRASAVLSPGPTEYFLTDPLVTALCPLSLEPGETTAVDLALGCGYSQAEALESGLRILRSQTRADLPRTAAAVIGLENTELGAAFDLLPALCFPSPAAAPVLQEALWPFGISGDLPIVCASYAGEAELARARQLMDAHLFLCGCGCDFDLVFLSRDGASYHRPLHTALSDALWHAGGELLRDARGGVHLLEDNAEAEAVRQAAVLNLRLSEDWEPPVRSTAWRSPLPTRLQRFPLQGTVRWDWGDDARFSFYVNRSLPPRAWQNMLTNGNFGYLATDCGSGHLWQGNARELQITPWLCQPNETEGPERLWLETGSGRHHSLFARPEDTACRVSFLPGAAVWEKRLERGLLRTTAFVPPDTDARVLLVELEGDVPPISALHWHASLLLAGNPEHARYCRTESVEGGLRCENPRGGQTAFYAFTSPAAEGFTGSLASALALDYDGVQGMQAQPVFALKLRPGRETVLVCGCDDPGKLRALCDPAAARAALAETLSDWKERTGALALRSPVTALDRLMNGWAAYQALAGRIMGRCSIYQSGGAFGFRDQLQDTVNLIGLDPGLARAQILRCCTRQYAEGDVQHWWHAHDGHLKGVRTRCSDDLLWLPWAVCEYVEKTGDRAILGEQLPYLASPVLHSGEKDRYEDAPYSDVRENVLRHCARALEQVMARGRGAHGLLRFGSGDWNDGLDAVEGESQWLSWFFLHVADRFGALCQSLGIEHGALDRFAEELATAANAAWDGAWFLRGYYASGKPLGSRNNAECQLDSIAQSWAALSGRADDARIDASLSSAVERLHDRENRLVRLFVPPFAGAEHPGYIESYGPGFRENGGQYTHGALWLVMALLRRNRIDEAWTLLRDLLPADRDVNRYLCEPFVIAADVYAAAGHAGEGGWSWYTGSAGWLWRIVTEELLGLRLREGLLYVEPRLPAALLPLTARYRGHEIQVDANGQIRVDSTVYRGGGLPL